MAVIESNSRMRNTQNRRRIRSGVGIAQIWAIAWSLLSVLPFVFIVLLAFKSTTDIYTDPVGLIGVDWRPQNFTEAWVGPPGGVGFAVFLLNTVIVTTVSIFLSLLIGSMTAYFLTVAPDRLRKGLMRIVLIATVTPVVMLLIPYYHTTSVLGLLSNPWALAIIYFAIVLPNTILIMYSFYLSFPKELREAASIDGLGAVATYRRIVLPLSKGPLVAVAMINGFNIWGETQIAIVMLTQASSRTIPVGLLAFQGDFQTNMGAIFAGLAIATAPILVTYLIFQRNITKGIALGGVFR